jgi:tetratricopeptide (TPR) repeat protein
MFTLKPLTREGLQAALRKVERYRLLNEPFEAESICQDVLEIDPDNQEALVLLILARTDQFVSYAGASVASARELLPRLSGEYERAYYGGIICERHGSSILERAASGHVAYGLFRQAMQLYEAAEAIRPPGNDDAILRWNTCARLIMRHPHVRPDDREPVRQMLE